MSAALLIDIILWGSVAAVGFIAFQRGPKVLTASLREGSMDFINIVPRIALGVIGSGYIAAVIPQEIITGWLGPNSGWFGVATAVVAGAATPGGPVIGFSVGAVALKAGGGPPPAFNATAPMEKPTTGPPGVAAPATTAVATPNQPELGPSQPVMISCGMTAAI